MSLFNNQNNKERFLWQQDELKSNDCQRESRNQNTIDLQEINEKLNQERQQPYLCRRCGRPCSFRIPSSFGHPCPCPCKRPCPCGRPGPTGADGLSAYLIAIEAGYTGTLEEWLSGLVGATGATGADGTDGLSAYLVAVEAGYTGTLEEWLSSLVGATGATGADGTQGVTGPTGESITPAYGFVYGQSSHTIQDKEAVVNNLVDGRMLNTTAQNNGILIHTAGMYYLSYQVNIGPNQYGSLNIAFDGIVAPEYHTHFSTNDRTSVVSGGGIIQIANNNTLVTINNTSDKAITIDSGWGSNNLNVVKIGDIQ